MINYSTPEGIHLLLEYYYAKVRAIMHTTGSKYMDLKYFKRIKSYRMNYFT